MMKAAYIFGTGGHARVIFSIIAERYESIMYVDLAPTAGEVINQDEFFNDFEEREGADIFLGLGSNPIRIKLYNRLKELNVAVANCISDHTFVAGNAQIGQGVVICPGCVIGAGAVVGNNTIVNTLSSVDHDCIVGDHSQITAGVTLGGTTIIGSNCFLGVKSATIPGTRIGDNSVVMAGSMVYKDVPDNVMVGGSPARMVKKL